MQGSLSPTVLAKNKTKYRDGNGNKWSVNAGGVINLDEGLDSVELQSPKVTDLA